MPSLMCHIESDMMPNLTFSSYKSIRECAGNGNELRKSLGLSESFREIPGQSPERG